MEQASPKTLISIIDNVNKIMRELIIKVKWKLKVLILMIFTRVKSNQNNNEFLGLFMRWNFPIQLKYLSLLDNFEKTLIVIEYWLL